MKVPFLSFHDTNLLIRSEIHEAFTKVFDGAWYILGTHLEEFEKNYAAFNQVPFCIGTSNGLDALHLCLIALDIGKGSEVIIPSNTFIATALAVSFAGATPVLAEPNLRTYNIDPAEIEKVITG